MFCPTWRGQQGVEANSTPGSSSVESMDGLPSIKDIFQAPVQTQEYIPVGTVYLARELYASLIANVVRYSVPYAWDHLSVEEGG